MSGLTIKNAAAASEDNEDKEKTPVASFNESRGAKTPVPFHDGDVSMAAVDESLNAAPSAAAAAIREALGEQPVESEHVGSSGGALRTTPPTTRLSRSPPLPKPTGYSIDFDNLGPDSVPALASSNKAFNEEATLGSESVPPPSASGGIPRSPPVEEASEAQDPSDKIAPNVVDEAMSPAKTQSPVKSVSSPSSSSQNVVSEGSKIEQDVPSNTSEAKAPSPSLGPDSVPPAPSSNRMAHSPPIGTKSSYSFDISNLGPDSVPPPPPTSSSIPPTSLTSQLNALVDEADADDDDLLGEGALPDLVRVVNASLDQPGQAGKDSTPDFEEEERKMMEEEKDRKQQQQKPTVSDLNRSKVGPPATEENEKKQDSFLLRTPTKQAAGSNLSFNVS